jgi:hypothetical protein
LSQQAGGISRSTIVLAEIAPMINFSLLIVPESAISPKSLWEKSLPTLIELLGDYGYTIVSDDTVEAVGIHRLRHTYRLEPGPATLTAGFTTTGDGKVEFVLDGDNFGMALAPGQKDQLLWMRLVVLGVQFAETFAVISNVCDPACMAERPGRPERPPNDSEPSTPSPSPGAVEAMPPLRAGPGAPPPVAAIVQNTSRTPESP